MFVVGVSGGIATGKSTVTAIMKEMGVPLVDADVIARQIVEPGRRAWTKIKTAFGEEVFLESGEINREALGKMVFSDAEKRKIINKITHPEIYREIQWQVLRQFLRGEQFVVLDLPLLFENEKFASYLYKTIVVACEDEIQLDRLMARNGYTQKEAIARIETQMPLEQKCKMASFVVENSGSQAATRVQVEGIVKYLRSSRQHLYLRAVWGGGLALVLGLIVALLMYIYS
ncbi:Dephospho-CoA kinase domain-containing protein [Chionoecetes opilio]|uniref:Dephospho-CoA kinase domain-containing protein n=1 Tax=Chionoecetes opilio TaxID=41210 RepID=A0A8J4Y9C9_CHIOP|nr:Dephospho-CoA kinase domain-containing protein [Chionoecetes opilio]